MLVRSNQMEVDEAVVDVDEEEGLKSRERSKGKAVDLDERGGSKSREGSKPKAVEIDELEETEQPAGEKKRTKRGPVDYAAAVLRSEEAYDKLQTTMSEQMVKMENRIKALTKLVKEQGVILEGMANKMVGQEKRIQKWVRKEMGKVESSEEEEEEEKAVKGQEEQGDESSSEEGDSNPSSMHVDG